MHRSSPSASDASPSRRRWPWRALLTALVAALLAAAGLAVASPAVAKTAAANVWVSSVGCSTGDDGTAVLEYEGLVDGDYSVTVTGEGYEVVVGSLHGHGQVPLEGLSPGLYAINVSISGWGTEVWGQFTVEACPSDVDLSVTPLVCSTGDDGEALLALTGLVMGEQYRYTVTGPVYDVAGSLEAVGETADIELIGMPPGNYVAYVEEVTPQGEVAGPNYDWIGFALEPCQPELTVEVAECAASGATGTAEVTLSNLVAGVEYHVQVTDAGVGDGTPYGGVRTVTGDADGTAAVEVAGLPAGHEYTVWVDGVWTAVPWEEPPWLGNGGNFTPLETVQLASSAIAVLQPCPAPAAGPVAPAKPAELAATGSGDTTGMLGSAALLFGIGGAALIAARRREVAVHDRG